MSDVTFTRDEAIKHVVSALTQANVDAGAELALVLGGELAAEMTVTAIRFDVEAVKALGVTEDDIRRVSATLRS